MLENLKIHERHMRIPYRMSHENVLVCTYFVSYIHLGTYAVLPIDGKANKINYFSNNGTVVSNLHNVYRSVLLDFAVTKSDSSVFFYICSVLYKPRGSKIVVLNTNSDSIQS